MDIQSLRLKLAFATYECAQPDDCPFGIDDQVSVRVHPTKSGSAYAQMSEPARVGGFIDTIEGTKALVMFTEREDDQGDLDYELVLLSQLRVPAKERLFDSKLQSFFASC